MKFSLHPSGQDEGREYIPCTWYSAKVPTAVVVVVVVVGTANCYAKFNFKRKFTFCTRGRALTTPFYDKYTEQSEQRIGRG